MIRLHNARIMPMLSPGDCSIVEGELWTDGGRISYVGPPREDMPAFEREIDLGGDLIIPGFKDAHTHNPMVFLRSFADGLPLHDWLFQQVFPREARLFPEAIYALTRLAVLELLSGGVTAAFDMYFYRDAYVQAVIDSGFRSILCGAVAAGDADWSVAARDFEQYNARGPLVGYRLGFHAEYTTSLERMEYVASLTHKYKAPMFVHSSETKGEVQGCIERHGVTPTVLFDRLGMYDHGGGGFHCVYMSEEDIDIFRRRKLCAVLNPASNLKLASGIAPVTRFLSEGIDLAIGTDGAASNNALDFFREMYLVTALAKYREADASVCDANRVLEMACVGGAKAMGLTDCDCIATGKKADMTVINLHRPNMHPLNNISKNIVYAGSKENVRLTMVNGKVLYENGEFFIGEDAGKLYAEADKISEAVR